MSLNGENFCNTSLLTFGRVVEAQYVRWASLVKVHKAGHVILSLSFHPLFPQDWNIAMFHIRFWDLYNKQYSYFPNFQQKCNQCMNSIYTVNVFY